jgi:hypothetical protein
MSTQTIEIDMIHLWMNKQYTSTGGITYHQNSILLPFFLRFMFFCDQCHDFCENDQRNNWSPSGGGPKNSEYLTKTFKILQTKYKDDIKWLLEIYKGQSLLSEEQNKFVEMLDINESESKNTDLLIEKIDYILKYYYDLIPISSSNVMLDEQYSPCSTSSKILLTLINLYQQGGGISTTIKNWDTYNITVDADKSKINLGSLLLFLCDRVSTNNDTKINLWNTPATKYDSASGSGTFSYLNKIGKSLSKITNNNTSGVVKEIDNTADNITISIKYDGLQLINIQYDSRHVDEDDIDMVNIISAMKDGIYNAVEKKDLNLIYALIEIINSSFAPYFLDTSKVTKKKISDLKDIIVLFGITIPRQLYIPFPTDNSFKTSWSKLSKPEGVSEFNQMLKVNGLIKTNNENGNPIYLTREQILFIFLSWIVFTYTITNKSSNILEQLNYKAINTKNLVHLTIHQFFNTKKNSIALNEKQSSVNYITNNYKPDASHADTYNIGILSKTLSDFGGIVTFNGFMNINNEFRDVNLFITFDRICSRIAALFMPFALFENLDISSSISPITVFAKRQALQSTSEAAKGLLALATSQFGKYNRKKILPLLKYKINNKVGKNNKKVKKSNKKIKHSDKVTKLAKKYRIPLNKNTVKNIKKLLTVQKKAKKLKVKLTKKNSKGQRIYKSEKELLRNIKQCTKSNKRKSTLSPKKRTSAQKEKVLRNKAKKYNIRITKTTSNGKRIYKTNKELLRDLKIKLKRY